MQALRTLCRPLRQHVLELTSKWKPEAAGVQMRLTSGGSTAETSVPSALELPPAHTSGDVCIVGAVRTPFGAFQGSLASVPATHLGGVAIKAALERAGLDPSHVQEVIMGNVISAGLGQAPARQAALGAGLAPSTICSTINKVCASGMKAVMLAAQSIQTGTHDVVVAGGMESMSNVPYYLPIARSGYRLGHGAVVDGLIQDGLWDPHVNQHMGECAEACAKAYSITRAQQDDHAVESFRRATEAAMSGATGMEVAPVQVPGKKGTASSPVMTDDALLKVNPEKLRLLAPAFVKEGGTVTPGNSSIIADGAAALVLVSAERASKLGLRVLAHIRGYADAAQEPQLFPTSPALAVPAALARAQMQQSEVDYWEINQAFSVVDLVNQQLLGLDPSRVNVHGGATALGHPIGASGAAIIVRLLTVLERHNGKSGVAAICNGGGGASAVVLQRTYTAAEGNKTIASCGHHEGSSSSGL
ncbi:Acetyl-CoA acetyltransferase, cytosolic [Trebouxia sp. C0010 RCD-2024]